MKSLTEQCFATTSYKQKEKKEENKSKEKIVQSLQTVQSDTKNCITTNIICSMCNILMFDRYQVSFDLMGFFYLLFHL